MASFGDEFVGPIAPPLENGVPNLDGVTVSVDGRTFNGWKTVTVRKNLEAIANNFSILVDEKFEGEWPLRPGTNTQIGIGTERVFTGRIEVVEPEFNADSRQYVISGRSNTGDLVDCTHEGPMEYKNITLDRLAEELVRPFGMKVFLSVLPVIIPKFAIKPGETIFEILTRAARLQGFFWIATRGGNLRLTTPGKGRSLTSLEQDVNILAGSATFNDAERFQTYKVKGQATGTSLFNGTNVSHPVGEARDNGVKRYRPFTFLAEGEIDSAQAKTRAQWEASVRLARAIRISVEVSGWRQQTGELWDINQIIKVKSAFLGIDADMLSISVEYTKSNGGGTKAVIGLTDAQAYTPQPVLNTRSDQDLILNLGSDNFESKLTRVGGVNFL